MVAKTIDDQGNVRTARRFDFRDWKFISEYVCDEYHRRKTARADRERAWAEIDRQVAMEPDVAFKYIIRNGKRVIDPKKHWMAETELPLQAQCLEVQTSDARRFLFQDSKAWFSSHAAVTDEYLRGIDFSSIILGDELEVPTKINQDNADKLVEGFLLHMFRQPFNGEDFYTRIDRINAEAFKYGMGVGRGRMYSQNLYYPGKNGVRKYTQKIPVLAPCSIKNLYLDDPKPSMHSAQLLEPAHIAKDHIKFENLVLACNAGSTDPDDEDGGWMPENVRHVIPDDDGFVTLLEMEGDIVVPRKTVRSIVIPGAIVTVVQGGTDTGGKVTRAVVRFRYRKSQQSSYLLFPYHHECADDVYPTSPLMKGRPIQILATDSANRLLDSAALKVAPPIGYDRTDMVFGQSGGPEVYPHAQWGTSDPGAIKVHAEVGGDPGTLSGMLQFAVNLYAELTGVLPSRLGAQTVSHTTAYAKNAELERGATRTVDYVRSIGQGPMTRWLDMAYQMGRDAIGSKKVSFWIDAYGGYVEVTKEQLPEQATFEWFGSGGPAEEQQKRQVKLQALQLALQMDAMAVQMGRPATVDIASAIKEVLREGRWTDLDAIVAMQQPGAPQDPALQMALLQELPGMTQ